MSAVKSIEQIEFSDMFARLKERGISQVDVARRLKMTGSQVSQILKGKRGTSALRLDALRQYVNEVCGEDQTPGMLRENPSESDLEIWKRRAKTAERELADLRNDLRAILEKPSSSKLDAMVESHLAAKMDDLAAARKPKL